MDILETSDELNRKPKPVLLYAMAFLVFAQFAVVVSQAHSHGKVKAEAVKAGIAFYDVDSNGKPKFHWRQDLGKCERKHVPMHSRW